MGNERAEYGKKIVVTVVEELERYYGSSFSMKNLRRMMQFAEAFPDKEIVVSLIRQLRWTHILVLIPITDSLKREFYIEMSKLEHWSVRTLRERIQSMLYERSAISKQPEETIAHDLNLLKSKQKLRPDVVFRDPYFLDFLGLRGMYSERDLESSILAALQEFITELGSDFAFLARQKRITILIAAGLSPFAPEAAAVQAGKIMLERINSCVARAENFAIETTLSGKNYARDIPRWQEIGYIVKLFFLRLPSPEIAIERVKNRVALGGHHIPDDVIRRRFDAGWKNFEELYKPLVDEWILYDNTNSVPLLKDKGGKV